MDFEVYKAAVLTTESKLPHDHSVAKEEFHLVFNAIAALSDLLDLMKKRDFYGVDVKDCAIFEKKYHALAQCLCLQAENNRPAAPEKGELFETVRMMGPVSDIRMLHSLVGCVGEAGELAKIGADMTAPGKKVIDEMNWLEEVGDFAWYEALGMDALGLTRDQRDEANIRKLKKRYPEGFSLEKAMNRNLGAERAELEAAGVSISAGEQLEKMGIEVDCAALEE